jgi:hypothetical protein
MDLHSDLEIYEIPSSELGKATCSGTERKYVGIARQDVEIQTELQSRYEYGCTVRRSAEL